MPAHNAMSNSMSSFGHSHSHSTSLDMTTFPTSDYDWGLGFGSGAMDLDLAPSSLLTEEPAEPEFKKLEFVDLDEKLGLAGLDISFDASAAREGKIRVRIHPPAASEGGEPAAQGKDIEEDHPMWHDAQDDLGPFLGVGTDFDSAFASTSSGLHPLDFSFPSATAASSSFSAASSPSHLSSPTTAFFSGAGSPAHPGSNEYEFELGSEYGSVGSAMSTSRAGSPGVGASGRRRVRIALRGMPGKGREGGEWEVEVC